MLIFDCECTEDVFLSLNIFQMNHFQHLRSLFCLAVLDKVLEF